MIQNRNQLVESYNKLADRYDAETETFHHRITRHVLISNLLAELGKGEPTKILDSGGGTGQVSLLLAKLGFDVTLSDISPRSLEVAREKFAEENLNIDVLSCDSEQTGLADGGFDFVMLNGGVISYTPNPTKLLAETNRILRTGGRIWFDFFNTVGWAMENDDADAKVALAAEDDRLIQMPDWDYPARVMSLDRVRALLGDTGFRIQSEFGLGVISHALPLAFRYGTEYTKELLDRYLEVELRLSRQTDCVGAAWSCMICAQKTATGPRQEIPLTVKIDHPTVGREVDR